MSDTPIFTSETTKEEGPTMSTDLIYPTWFGGPEDGATIIIPNDCTHILHADYDKDMAGEHYAVPIDGNRIEWRERVLLRCTDPEGNDTYVNKEWLP